MGPSYDRPKPYSLWALNLHLAENGQKWLKMGKMATYITSDQKLSKTEESGQKCQKRAKMATIGQKTAKIIKNSQKCLKLLEIDKK